MLEWTLWGRGGYARLLVACYLSTSSKRKDFRALVIPVLDYELNTHTNKNSISPERIQNHGTRWICGSRFCPHTHDCLDHLECCTEPFWQSLSTRRSICLWPWSTYDILHNHVSLQFSDYYNSGLLQSGPIHCPFYANSLPLTFIVTHFSWTVFFGGIPFLLTFCQLPTILLLGVRCIILYVLINLSLCILMLYLFWWYSTSVGLISFVFVFLFGCLLCRWYVPI